MCISLAPTETSWLKAHHYFTRLLISTDSTSDFKGMWLLSAYTTLTIDAVLYTTTPSVDLENSTVKWPDITFDGFC